MPEKLPHRIAPMVDKIDRPGTYWDTADCYENGKKRRVSGKLFSANTGRSEKNFHSQQNLRAQFEGMTKLLTRSLERLKTDYIDLYFVHGISSINEINDETKAWSEKTKKEKKIRFSDSALIKIWKIVCLPLQKWAGLTAL